MAIKVLMLYHKIMKEDFNNKEASSMPGNEREKDPYARYQELGGIINKEDYENALKRLGNAAKVSDTAMEQVENIAKFAGIEIPNEESAGDPRIKLYAILRGDNKPEEVKYHHSQMSDQRLFAEALRMLGDTEALDKLIDAYHKVGTHCPICFKVVTPGEKCL